MAQFVKNAVFNGLGTYSETILEAGPYVVSGHILLPTITNGGGASSCLVTINQNGSPVYVGQAGAEGFTKDVLCAAADVIAVVLTSSATADSGLNVIKTMISITGGV